jgi:ketosteroid isomerase-like protein
MTSFTSHTRDLIQALSGYGKLILMISALSLGTATNDLNASSEEDAKAVAALDTKYQAAVKSNDAATMDQILADDFVLVNGRGKVSSKADLIESARKKEVTYERQDEEPGTEKVRVWGDTAVVTALLWIKAEQGGNQSITNYGLATLTSVLQRVGITCSAKLPCRYLKRNPNKIMH